MLLISTVTSLAWAFLQTTGNQMRNIWAYLILYQLFSLTSLLLCHWSDTCMLIAGLGQLDVWSQTPCLRPPSPRRSTCTWLTWRVWERREEACALIELSHPTMSASSSSWTSAETLLPGVFVILFLRHRSFSNLSHSPLGNRKGSDTAVLGKRAHHFTAQDVRNSLFSFWHSASQCVSCTWRYF